MASYLLDTNVLLRSVQKAAPEHPIVMAAISRLTARGEELYVAPQVLVEFWVVATRPTNVNGFGWATPLVVSEIGQILGQFPLLDEPSDLFTDWLALVTARDIKGRKAHDVKLVALMQAKGISHVLTFNVADFSGYAGIAPIDPVNVV
ncbi:MAG TPA: PIN domain-containing protein [Blastocatellia bacterium]|nr:PIN domain-containing protein [Blastocatellia bacterium]HMV81637.1 PIN domain-containing protein [Blastocatellia bacterium]HMZ17973.1 PIN domain-containing protein [Blastocatellia bacterium]HNG33758.1 PIN domain-containing protein [Blastocatellia bacterium]